MTFFSHHGYYAEERTRGNNYLLEVEIGYDMEKAASTDELEHALNYEEVYKICKEVMDTPHYLIESVARSIADRIKTSFDYTDYITVRLKKSRPELGGAVAYASVEYTLD